MAHRKKSRSPSIGPVLFVDTVYWLALLRKKDQHHESAAAWKHWLDGQKVTFVTTDAVLWEWLNASADPALRQTAALGYRACHASDDVEVLAYPIKTAQTALAQYESHKDKEWSLTDCFSFAVMEERRLTAALTTDHHFEQAGVRALLKEKPPL